MARKLPKVGSKITFTGFRAQGNRKISKAKGVKGKVVKKNSTIMAQGTKNGKKYWRIIGRK